MASRQEVLAVQAAAVVQGIVLVAFPAVSAVLTSPAQFGLTATAYGSLFVPQATTAVLFSLLGAGLARRLGGKAMLLGGLAGDLMAMALLCASRFTMDQHALAYGLLLAGTGFLGCGFGLAVPALNTFTAAFFPTTVDRAILTLNALLGLGTTLAPILSSVFVGLGIWWGLPASMCVLTLALLVFVRRLPLGEQPLNTPATPKAVSPAGSRVPSRFWLYATFALVYGICETLNGNWASVYLSSLGASVTVASLALSCFWVSVTGGRILFATVERWCPATWTYRGLPPVLALAFIAVAMVPRGHPSLALVCFGVAGLGCSALLPLVVSFGQQELAVMGTAVAGGLLGFYQMGYGLAAFGVGPVQKLLHADLGGLYRGMAILALGLEVLAFLIVAKAGPTKTPASD